MDTSDFIYAVRFCHINLIKLFMRVHLRFMFIEIAGFIVLSFFLLFMKFFILFLWILVRPQSVETNKIAISVNVQKKARTTTKIKPEQ